MAKFKCACGLEYKPPHFPYVRRCKCGAEITVNKPVKELPNDSKRIDCDALISTRVSVDAMPSAWRSMEC